MPMAIHQSGPLSGVRLSPYPVQFKNPVSMGISGKTEAVPARLNGPKRLALPELSTYDVPQGQESR